MLSMATAPSARTKVRRQPARATYERETIHEILDEALLAHVAFLDAGQPIVIPTLQARVGEIVYFHGSAASRAIRMLGNGAPACLTVTLLDGLVLARSAFHHSVNYRSVVVLGSPRLVEGPDERLTALEAFTEQLIPDRWGEVRPPSPKELNATRVLAMALDEASAKLRTGPPADDEEDFALHAWAGVIPLRTAAGSPVPDPRLAEGIEPSRAAEAWVADRTVEPSAGPDGAT